SGAADTDARAIPVDEVAGSAPECRGGAADHVIVDTVEDNAGEFVSGVVSRVEIASRIGTDEVAGHYIVMRIGLERDSALIGRDHVASARREAANQIMRSAAEEELDAISLVVGHEVALDDVILAGLIGLVRADADAGAIALDDISRGSAGRIGEASDDVMAGADKRYPAQCITG